MHSRCSCCNCAFCSLAYLLHGALFVAVSNSLYWFLFVLDRTTSIPTSSTLHREVVHTAHQHRPKCGVINIKIHYVCIVQQGTWRTTHGDNVQMTTTNGVYCVFRKCRKCFWFGLKSIQWMLAPSPMPPLMPSGYQRAFSWWCYTVCPSEEKSCAENL